jgi:glucosylceramidase
MKLSVVLIFSIQVLVEASLPCIPRETTSGGSIVCVCNSTYCDTIDRVTPSSPGTFTSFTTSKAGLRFQQVDGIVGDPLPVTDVNATITLHRTTTYQSIIGFGGAFTDAAGINILSLDKDAQTRLLRSYFSEDGLEYNVGRIPIAGSDFSTRAYSYDDNSPGDFGLANFSLQYEDYVYKIPVIQEAMSMSTDEVYLFGSAWAPPTWMKTNHRFNGDGYLIGDVGGEYYDTWALYHVKFLQAYEENGVNVWGLTTGNEPYAASCLFNCLRMTWEEFAVFISANLGPALESAGYGDVTLMMFDDNRNQLINGTNTVLSNQDAIRYVDGIGIHWYTDNADNPDLLRQTHESFPDYFMLYTEACFDFETLGYVGLGQWRAADYYAIDIMAALRNWVTGWVDWNLALNMEGGPNWVNNNVDSPIRVNSTAGEFYKQPHYYVMGHFSKFLPRGSVHFEVEVDNDNIHTVGFMRPDGGTVVILYNRHSQDVGVTILDNSVGEVNTVVPANGIQTVVWWTA